MRAIAALLAVGLVLWSGVLALVVLGQALGASRYVDWRDMPVAWLGEVAIAGCSIALAAVVIVRGMRESDRPTLSGAATLLVVGAGFLAVGGLAIAAGWLGLQVPTTSGYDVLERGEPLWIIAGLVTGAFGLLVMLVAGFAEAIRSGD